MFLPLKIFILYIFTTFIIFFWGPIEYESFNRGPVLIFMLFFMLFFITGYFCGIKFTKITPRMEVYSVDKIGIKWTKLAIFISLTILLYIFGVRLLQGKVSLSLSAMGANYNNFYEAKRSEESIGYSIENILIFFSGLFRFAAIILGFYYYKKIPKYFKIAFLLYLTLVIIVYTISFGNQKTLGDIIVFFLAVFAIKNCKKITIKKAFFPILFLLLVFIIFSYAQYQRLEHRDIYLDNINSYMPYFKYYNDEHLIFNIFGPKLGFGMAIILCNYVAPGYYTLSKCMELPFIWTYGLGNSRSLMLIGERFFNFDVINDQYIYRMSETFDLPGIENWHTVFPWFASDLTFPGTIIFFALMAYVFAVAWKESVIYKNPISIVLVAFFSLGLVFVPANNVLLHGIDIFLATVPLFFIWLLFHKKFNALPVEIDGREKNEQLNCKK